MCVPNTPPEENSNCPLSNLFLSLTRQMSQKAGDWERNLNDILTSGAHWSFWRKKWCSLEDRYLIKEFIWLHCNICNICILCLCTVATQQWHETNQIKRLPLVCIECFALFRLKPSSNIGFEDNGRDWLHLSVLRIIRKGQKVTVLIWNVKLSFTPEQAATKVSTSYRRNREPPVEAMGRSERLRLWPGLMSCLRDNARRGVDMWFGRKFYAIF